MLPAIVEADSLSTMTIVMTISIQDPTVTMIIQMAIQIPTKSLFSDHPGRHWAGGH
jgi:hypothetical protein